MILESWNIYWNEFASNTYTYGSKIQFHARDDVEYENELMPPGTVIKEWFSRTSFQRDKIEPMLPLIDGEGTYQFLSNIDCEEDESALFRLVFYDRFEKEVDSISIWEPMVTFRCPLQTYSYRLQLINGGMTHFRFHSAMIREISDETDEQTQKTE